jgi:hypothetical protein
MAITNIILGDSVDLFIDGILVACATDISIAGQRKEIEATCAGSGDVEQMDVGKSKYTFDISVLWRQTTGVDVATNVTANEFIDMFQGKTEISIVFKSVAALAGDIIYTGVGFVTNFKLSGSVNNIDKFTCSGFLNSLVPTEVPV